MWVKISGHVEGQRTPRLGMVRVRGTCRICGYQGMLDPHHIISQAQARRLNRHDLITNPGNVVHICRRCHDLTPASQKRAKYEAKGRQKTYEAKGRQKTKRAQKKAKSRRCEAMTDVGGRCKHPAKPGEHVCGYHLPRRKLGYRRKW